MERRHLLQLCHSLRIHPRKEKKYDSRKCQESNAKEGQRARPIGRQVSSNFIHHIIQIARAMHIDVSMFFRWKVLVLVGETLTFGVNCGSIVYWSRGGHINRRCWLMAVSCHPA
jgi:predicted DNA repair protein MutK